MNSDQDADRFLNKFENSMKSNKQQQQHTYQ